MSIVYIGIGANLGDRKASCLRSIAILKKKDIVIRKISSLYETEPWGVEDQPKFLNMAIEIETGLTPIDLLGLLKEIEKEIGRDQTYKWGPRTIDLDILLYSDLIMDGENLKIPHPHMHDRDFVLRPLFEIAPDIKHPVLQVTVRELLQTLYKKAPDIHGVV
jgi:2-amino-4-hydroxy-6-hydroxymethyldihydropteridine diphosphokinase